MIATMTDCPADDTLNGLLEGTLAEPETSEVEAHLEACEKCRERVQVSLRETEDRWQSWQRLIDESSLADSPSTGQSFFERIVTGTASDTANINPEDIEDQDDWTRILLPTTAPNAMGQIGQYLIFEEVGRGGMGIVLRGHDPDLDRCVAIKIMRPSQSLSPGHKERFLREARAAAAIEHPYVVPVYQVGEQNGLPFLVMKYLEGESLAARLKSGSLPPTLLKQVAHQLMCGLEAIHDAGHIHRDIKPANVWLESPNDHVRILDFGLTRAHSDSGLTQNGTVLGTPAFMSPEQAAGENVDVRSDLFSAGAVLYQAATGIQAFSGATPFTILSALANETPSAVCKVADGVDDEFSDLVMTLLSKTPEQRPESASTVIDRLHEISSTGRGGGNARVALAALFGGLIALSVIIFRLSTSQGELIVEIADGVNPDDIVVSASGEDGVEVIDAAKNWRIKLADGRYQVSLDGGNDRLSLSRNVVTVSRSSKERVRVSLRRPGSPSSPDRAVAEWVHSIGGSVHLQMGAGKLGRALTPEDGLPDEPIKLFGINLWNAANVHDDDISRITDLGHFRNLFIGKSQTKSDLTDVALQNLAKCDLPQLHTVALHGMTVDTPGLKALHKLNTMQFLKLHKVRLPDNGMEQVARIQGLQNLSLSTMDVPVDSLKPFRDHKIQTLYLVDIPTCDDEFLRLLPAWKELKFLSIRDCPITNEGLLEALKYPILDTIRLQRIPDITSTTWAALAELPKLRFVELTDCGDAVDDSVLRSLAKMKNLEQLIIKGTKLPTESLEHLTALTELKFLTLENDPPFPEAALKKIRAAIPDCRVIQASAKSN